MRPGSPKCISRRANEINRTPPRRPRASQIAADGVSRSGAGGRARPARGAAVEQPANRSAARRREPGAHAFEVAGRPAGTRAAPAPGSRRSRSWRSRVDRSGTAVNADRGHQRARRGPKMANGTTSSRTSVARLSKWCHQAGQMVCVPRRARSAAARFRSRSVIALPSCQSCSGDCHLAMPDSKYSLNSTSAKQEVRDRRGAIRRSVGRNAASNPHSSSRLSHWNDQEVARHASRTTGRARSTARSRAAAHADQRRHRQHRAGDVPASSAASDRCQPEQRREHRSHDDPGCARAASMKSRDRQQTRGCRSAADLTAERQPRDERKQRERRARTAAPPPVPIRTPTAATTSGRGGDSCRLARRARAARSAVGVARDGRGPPRRWRPMGNSPRRPVNTSSRRAHRRRQRAAGRSHLRAAAPACRRRCASASSASAAAIAAKPALGDPHARPADRARARRTRPRR